MTPQAVKAALESLLVSILPDMPTAWGNVTFDPKVDAVDTNGDPVAWVRPAFRPGQSFEAEIGRDGLSRRTGAFIVQVFVPKGEGSGAAMETAATIEEAFRRQSVGGVECGEAYTEDLGSDGNGWYQVNVIVPWWAWIGE